MAEMLETLLSAEECERYHRQMLLPEWGEAGQARLKAGRVFIAGAGGTTNATPPTAARR